MSESEKKYSYMLVSGVQFEIRNGWFKLVDGLLRVLALLDPEKQIKINTIKQKFGGLRVYIDWNGSPSIYKKINEIISVFEKESFYTCEVCGRPGQLRRNNFLQTLCDEHYKEYKKVDSMSIDNQEEQLLISGYLQPEDI